MKRKEVNSKDSDGFDDFVKDMAESLLRTAYLLTWNVTDAEDLVQEAFVRTSKHWARVRVMEHPLSYVRRIVVNLALSGARKRERSSRELRGVGLPHRVELDDETAATALERIEERDEIRQLLAMLSARQRVLLVLRYFDGLTDPEIAAELGWPIGTVKSSASRALVRLQRGARKAMWGDAAQRAARRGEE